MGHRGRDAWKKYTTVVVTSLLVSSMVAVGLGGAFQLEETKDRQTISKIRDVTITNKVDNDGDGYYSNFDLDIEADTKCDGCYDEDGIVGDSEGEYYFAVFFGWGGAGIPDVKAPEEGYLDREEYLRYYLSIGIETLEDHNFERGEIEFHLYLYDSDGVTREKIDSWTLTVRYEPTYED